MRMLFVLVMLLMFSAVEAQQTTLEALRRCPQCPRSKATVQYVPPGTLTTMVLSSPWRSQPNTISYHVGLAWDISKGQIIGNQIWIPIDRDELFWWSLYTANSLWFRNSVGFLDGNGNAVINLVIPKIPALRGKDIYAVAVISYAGRYFDVSTKHMIGVR